MASITITLTDAPMGGVSIHTDFRPAIGAPCSAAQSAALDIISAIRRNWDTKAPLLAALNAPPPMQERGR